MAEMRHHWLRWYNGTATDPKWRVVAAESGAPVHAVLAVWALMMEEANDASPRGSLSGWNDRVAGAALDLPGDTVRAIREAMEGLVLTDGDPTSWVKRQPKREDGSAERAKRWRDAQKEVANATERNRTQPNDREEKRREENTTPPLSPPAGGERQAKRGRTLPDDFAPSGAHRQLAARLGVDLDAEWEQFVDYHLAKGSAFKDWPAALRTWLRNARRYAPAGGNGRHPDPAVHRPGDEWQRKREDDEAALAAWEAEIEPRLRAASADVRREITAAAKAEAAGLEQHPRYDQIIRAACLRLYGERVHHPRPG